MDEYKDNESKYSYDEMPNICTYWLGEEIYPGPLPIDGWWRRKRRPECGDGL